MSMMGQAFAWRGCEDRSLLAERVEKTEELSLAHNSEVRRSVEDNGEVLETEVLEKHDS